MRVIDVPSRCPQVSQPQCDSLLPILAWTIDAGQHVLRA
eukprot:CAMPEP_0202877326 /NCGR_PEP_ID=MMETSP1391-20130828/30475_1 /ASSEMBLY_ACC=CAM_ASM_000867 /TAXON_ID=1034604 /ORGANISM="Chlamydomonas leiostraca, Strain SAG 11-49" /LENGTH=38 /DNA_ID= /DNA_START= /DNA_END= /DNA_ORIENTATION=